MASRNAHNHIQHMAKTAQRHAVFGAGDQPQGFEPGAYSRTYLRRRASRERRVAIDEPHNQVPHLVLETRLQLEELWRNIVGLVIYLPVIRDGMVAQALHGLKN